MANYSFGSKKLLLHRIQHAITEKEKVIFLVGSGLTCSKQNPFSPGVLSVFEIIEEIKKNLKKSNSIELLEEEMKNSNGENEYQVAMRTLLMCAGQDELNKVITNAVLSARLNSEASIQSERIDQSVLEKDISIWNIRTGIDTIAKLHLVHKDVFTGPILTTNFDPLIEIAIRKNGGGAHTLFLTNDGSFNNVIATQSVGVVHFHGYWHGSDTLHTSDQITKERPLLKGSIKKILSDHTLVVLGYGGWNDVLTNTIIEVAEEGGNFKNILWAFRSEDEKYIISNYKYLFDGFKTTLNQRVVLYKGIDADSLLDSLVPEESIPGSQVASSAETTLFHRELPPLSEIWSGRLIELERIMKSDAKVIFITGIGGQGKTALASHYVRERFDSQRWELWDWRDCKEESNRLHTKLLSIIEFLSNGQIRAFEIYDETTQNLIQLLFDTLKQRRILFVFDNVDNYIDLEKFEPSGSLHLLYQNILNRNHRSQFIFTCRPEIRIVSGGVDSIPLSGLSEGETFDLFNNNNFNISDERIIQVIRDSFHLTGGHPLLLNIIIGQAKRDLAAGLKFVDDLKENKNLHAFSLAEATLKSVWLLLNNKQQILLRGIAENVKPEPEEIMFKILESELNYNQFSKSLRTLKSLNLIVVRTESNRQTELIDLHPLVKQFIRDKYPKNERSKYITLFVDYYNSLVVLLKKTLSSNTPFSVFEDWTSKIELEIAKDDFKTALVSLHEIHEPILIAGYHEEYLRISLKLFLHINWRHAILEEFRYFHEEFKELIWLSVHMGHSDIESFLNQYVELIPGKSIYYINYCDMQCYYNWFQGNFGLAIEWGEKGTHLEETSKIQTNSNLHHNLNLAYRDSKEEINLRKALKFFLNDADVDHVLELTKPDGINNGTNLGNVGRCYDFIGEYDTALKCYKKSLSFLLEYVDINSKLNTGYAAFWIGNILMEKKDINSAYRFYKFAYNTWERTSKYKAQMVNEKILSIHANEAFNEKMKKLSDFEIERFCKDFIQSA